MDVYDVGVEEICLEIISDLHRHYKQADDIETELKIANAIAGLVE